MSDSERARSGVGGPVEISPRGPLGSDRVAFYAYSGGSAYHRIHTFFSFTYRNVLYQLALIHDFEFVGKEPDEDTGMWIVRRLRHPRARIVSLDAIYRAAHLIPVYYGEGAVPRTLTAEHSLDHYHFFYVNKFIDHHAFEIARKY